MARVPKTSRVKHQTPKKARFKALVEDAVGLSTWYNRLCDVDQICFQLIAFKISVSPT